MGLGSAIVTRFFVNCLKMNIYPLPTPFILSAPISGSVIIFSTVKVELQCHENVQLPSFPVEDRTGSRFKEHLSGGEGNVA